MKIKTKSSNNKQYLGKFKRIFDYQNQKVNIAGQNITSDVRN